MRFLDVNNDESIKLSAKLEKLHKSAFPSAVRNTLNKAGFEMKNQVPLVASKVFITRQKSFFKRFTVVEKAKGFNVDKMQAKVGIDATKDKTLADNLEAQELGSMVKGKKLIPHDDSRVSKNQNKRVSSRNYLNKVKAHNASRAYKSNKGSRKSKFISAIMSTSKSGKRYMLLKTNSNKGMVYEVSNVSSNRRNKKLKFKVKKLYSVREKNTHKVKASRFMEKSAMFVSKDIEKFYKEAAEFQFKKYLK